MTKTKKVLIVDDDVVTLKILEKAVASMNVSVVTAESGSRALDLLAEEPDLIISDYDMPGLNGLELLLTVRERGLVTPVIWVTGKATQELTRETWRLGVFDLFQKPFKVKAVLDQVREALLVKKEELISRKPSFLSEKFYQRIGFEVDKSIYLKLEKHCKEKGISLTTYFYRMLEREFGENVGAKKAG